MPRLRVACVVFGADLSVQVINVFRFCDAPPLFGGTHVIKVAIVGAAVLVQPFFQMLFQLHPGRRILVLQAELERRLQLSEPDTTSPFLSME